jgi:hypothetical protein
MFPQKALQCLRIQTLWDLAEVHDSETRASRQVPAFTEDLNAPVLIEGQFPPHTGHHQQRTRLRGAKPIFKLANPAIDGFHFRCDPLAVVASSAATRASISSISMAFAVWFSTLSAALTFVAGGVAGSTITLCRTDTAALQA